MLAITSMFMIKIVCLSLIGVLCGVLIYQALKQERSRAAYMKAFAMLILLAVAAWIWFSGDQSGPQNREGSSGYRYAKPRR